jgi:hypothetical protein
MSKKNEFVEALKTSKKAAEELPGFDVLRDFCRGVKDYVGETIECDAVPSQHVNYGQEYKVIITYYPSSYSSTLLRAYLNPQGKPYLDLYDKQGAQQCQDVDEFRQRLLAFLSVPGIADMLEEFKRDTSKTR